LRCEEPPLPDPFDHASRHSRSRSTLVPGAAANDTSPYELAGAV
jgi:hypothetical protein